MVLLARPGFTGRRCEAARRSLRPCRDLCLCALRPALTPGAGSLFPCGALLPCLALCWQFIVPSASLFAFLPVAPCLSPRSHFLPGSFSATPTPSLDHSCTVPVPLSPCPLGMSPYPSLACGIDVFVLLVVPCVSSHTLYCILLPPRPAWSPATLSRVHSCTVPVPFSPCTLGTAPHPWLVACTASTDPWKHL